MQEKVAETNGSVSEPRLEYDPNKLLDAVSEKLQVRNDARLSKALDVAPPVISKIRHFKLPVGASMLIKMHEATGYSIRELRDLMGDRRKCYRPIEIADAA